MSTMRLNKGGDERIVSRDVDADQRGNPHRAADAERTEDGLMSREERLAMLRNEWQQVALPAPPKDPNWHWFWASTTSSTDTIHRRQKLGYTLVKKDELPDFKIEKSMSGDYADYITCNEMILMKIPTDVWQDIMQVFHHEAPMQEETSIREQLESRKEQLNSQAGREVIRNEGGDKSGIDQLGTNKRAPRFT